MESFLYAKICFVASRTLYFGDTAWRTQPCSCTVSHDKDLLRLDRYASCSSQKIARHFFLWFCTLTSFRHSRLVFVFVGKFQRYSHSSFSGHEAFCTLWVWPTYAHKQQVYGNLLGMNIACFFAFSKKLCTVNLVYLSYLRDYSG